MTRINTNVSSLNAQKTLQRSNVQLQEALTRLSTGLRINVGKDDPAGLIASEVLRSDIISTQRAITNSERANQLIATADSALGQVSALLNDIRGLVSEAANSGALSLEQIAANQLQIDSSLEAIDRIAQITSFQGRKLLDGSLDFLAEGVDNTKIQDLKIDLANFGTQSSINVAVDIVTQATKGSLNYAFGAAAGDVSLQVGGKNGVEAFNFAAGSTISSIASAINLVSDATGVEAVVEQGATAGSIVTSSFGTNNDIVLTADQAGFDEGNIRVKYSAGGTAATTVTYTAGTGSDPDTLDVQLQTQAFVAATATVDDDHVNSATSAVYRLVQSGANNDLDVTVTPAGSVGAGITFNIDTAVAVGASSFNAATRTLTIGTSTLADANALIAANGALNTAIAASGLTVTLANAAGNDGTGTFTTSNNVAYETTHGIGTANNAILFTARVQGAEFNNVDVNYVDDDLLLASAGLAAGSEVITYNHDAQAASAAINTAIANTDLTITAATAGSAFNGVQVLYTSSGSVVGNNATATYNAAAKTLTLDINAGTTDANAVLAAINSEGTFTAALDTSQDATNDGSGVLTAAEIAFRDGRFGNTGNSGGDAGTLYIRLQEGRTTASQIITALGAAGNAKAGALFSAVLTVDNDGTGVVSSNAYSDAFTGGVAGGAVVATGQQVVDAINNDATAGAVLSAALATDETGITPVTAFQEFAYSGSASTNNRLQLLGPENSRNIRFVSNPGQALSVDLSTDPQVTARSTATLTGTNANASLVFQAATEGPEFDGTQIRFVANDGTGQDTVVYEGQESRSFADLRFTNTGANSGLRIEAATRGVDFNNVDVFITDTGAETGNTATATYNATTKRLTIDINDGTTTANTILAAINTEGTFSASLNFAGDATNNGSAAIVTADVSATTALANTGATGGAAGTLTFTVANTTTAAGISTLLSGDSVASKFFFANNFGTSTGAGLIDFFNDSGRVETSGGIASEGTLIVNLATDANGLVTSTANDLIAYFDDPANAAALGPLGISISNAEGSDGTGRLTATPLVAGEFQDLAFATSGTTQSDAQSSLTTSAVNGTTATVTVTAVDSGAAFDGVTLQFVNNPLLTGGGDETVAYDSLTKTLTVGVKQGVTTAQHVVDAINLPANGLNSLFTAALGGATGGGFVNISDTGVSSGGVVTTGTPSGVGLLGNEDLAETGLTFNATTFGSDSFVSVVALSGSFDLTDSSGTKVTRSVGTDVNAQINGIQAVAKGLKASINTASLDIGFTVDASLTDGDSFSFTITGGGAQFQLGPDVVSNQQARIGIQGVNTATLGGVNGKLFELRSGGIKALETNVNGAGAVIEEVISQVTSLRGRLGAFQKTTLETNIFTLSDTLENLTEAESSIRDADFAAESARLTRAQILVQSGTAVLSIANSNPQNVLALLR